MSMYKVIARYCHIINPGKPKGTDRIRWSIQGLVHKQDPQLPTLIAEVEATKKNGFPSGFPHKADSCLLDCAVEYPNDTVLRDYYVLNANTPLEIQGKQMSQPNFVNKFNQKLTDPRADSDITGHYAYIDVGFKTYQQGSQGIKAYLNGVMDTGEIGPISVEDLSSTSTSESMFANVTTPPPVSPDASMFAGVGAPSAPVAAPAPVMTPPPAPPAAPAPVAAPVRMMTPKAGGASYEAMIGAGWTDALLIEHGMMMPGF